MTWGRMSTWPSATKSEPLQAIEFYREHPLEQAQHLRWLFRISLDPLRDDPRFEAVLAANGIAGRRPVRLPPESATD